MNRVIFTALLLTILTRSLSAFSVTSGTTIYTIVEGDFTWHDAKLDAESFGGHLATVTSSQEWQKIETLVYNFSLSNSTGFEYWLGATDEEVEGIWKWVTGETFSFSLWGGGQPTYPNSPYQTEHYLHLTDRVSSNPYSAYPWNDSDNRPYHSMDGYILETTVPEPSSYALLLGGLALGLVTLCRR
jgi:hypothetical protein